MGFFYFKFLFLVPAACSITSLFVPPIHFYSFLGILSSLCKVCHSLCPHFFFYFIEEILILGCGRNIEPPSPELRRFIRSTSMKLEAVDSVTIRYIMLLFKNSSTALIFCSFGHKKNISITEFGLFFCRLNHIFVSSMI